MATGRFRLGFPVSIASWGFAVNTIHRFSCSNRLHSVHTVDGSEIRRSPVEEKVVYPTKKRGFSTIQTVVGNGISEPSKVLLFQRIHPFKVPEMFGKNGYLYENKHAPSRTEPPPPEKKTVEKKCCPFLAVR